MIYQFPEIENFDPFPHVHTLWEQMSSQVAKLPSFRDARHLLGNCDFKPGKLLAGLAAI